MKTNLFEIGFFSFLFVLLISLALYVGWEVRGQLESNKLDNVVMVKRCGNKLVTEH